MICFFFQAEDGIRDYDVTGVQTCALPISAVADILEGSGVLGRYNVTPGSYLPGVRVDENGGTTWSLMRWGLIPRWAKPDRIPDRTFNARCETVAEKPSFRNAYANRRCVIPISGYYEWTDRKSVV